MQSISEPTIFFPGTLCDERVWMPVWREMNLQQRSYVPLQWAETLEHMLALSNDRLASFTPPVHLIGFSMGGYIAALTALAHPKNIASLTLIGYSPTGLSEQEIQQRKSVISAINAKKSVTMSSARLKHFFSDEEFNQKETVSVVTDMESDLGPGVLKAHIQSTTPRPNLTDALQQAPFPIHFIAGEKDRVAPASQLRTLSESMARGSFTEISDSAHMMLLCQPQQVATYLYRLLTR